MKITQTHREIVMTNRCIFNIFLVFCDFLALTLAQSAFQIPPSFTALPPREVIHSQGRPLKIPCAAVGHPQPRLEWYLNGERLIVSLSSMPETSRWGSKGEPRSPESKQSALWDLTELFPSGRLRSGWLYCVAVNTVGRAISPPVWIRFAKIDESKPCETRTLTVKDQTYLRLNCTVPESTPPATVRWMYRQPSGFMGFIHENRTFAMDDDGNLLIATVGLPPSATLYLFCSASNSILRTMRTDCDNLLQIKRSPSQSYQSPAGPFLMARSPRSQTRLLNETVELRCLISPFPGTEIQWLWKSTKFDSTLEWKSGRWSTKYNEVFPQAPRVEVRNEGILLSIERLRFEHAGVYTCQTVNKVGYTSKAVLAIFELVVESIPLFDVMPVDTTVPIGGSTQLRCEPHDEERSKTEVRWHMNGEPIERHLDGDNRRLAGNSLILSNLGMHDSAVFQCNISNQHGFQFVNAYVNVWNSPPAIIHGPPEETIIAEGQKAIIPCKTVGAPTPRIHWTRDGSVTASDEIGRGRRKMVLLPDGSLEIKKTSLADSGMYKCVVGNRFGSSSASGRLVVRQATRITSGPLRVGSYALQKTTENGTIITSIGTEVSLFCRAETDAMEVSKLLVKWQWLPLSKSSALQLEGETGTSGGYTELPTDNIRETQRKISRNSVESSLILLKPQSLHSGTYRCQTFNGLDNDSRTVDVIIQGPPDPPTETSLNCTHVAKRGTALLSWTPSFDNNAPIVDIQIEYAIGFNRPIGKAQMDLVEPFSPLNTNVILKALNASVQSKTWRTLKHSLVSRPSQTSTWQAYDDLATVNLTQGVALVPIHPDVAYQFRVRLVNRVGISDPGPLAPGLNEEEQKRCLLKPQTPTVRPKKLEIYGNVPNTLTVTWKPIPPIRHNGPGLRYHLTIRCLDCEQSMQDGGALNETIISDWNQSHIVFSNLPVYDIFSQQWPIEIFKQYEVSLTVSNALGLSKAGTLIARGWSAEAPPTIAPYRLRATRVEASMAELTWEWPPETSGAVNGFFIGLRIEWCLAEKDQICDRYKVIQDVKLAEPPKELCPNLRVDPADLESRSRERNDWDRNYTVKRIRKSTLVPYSQHRRAVLRNLPGLSHLRVWIRLLNIQYEGPGSDILLVLTKEGVPEAVSEFIHSFAGVNYVEVAWAKPFQSNGILTGYLIDVISDVGRGRCDKSEESCEFTLYQKKIADPDQMATRLTGLEINSSYKLLISALTAVGAGEPRELRVHTAKQRLAKSPAEFVVSPVYGSTTTLNVSLVRPLEATATLNDENRHPLLQRDGDLLESDWTASTLMESGEGDGLRAFLVQYKRLKDENWEETEKEFDKNWQIIENLAPGEEYDMRVILARSPSLSYVSPIRMLRVPRPGEIGFGLSGEVSTTLHDTLKTPLGVSANTGDASFVLKIFLPLAITLFLLALVLTVVCCLRGPLIREPVIRRLRAPKTKPSAHVIHQLNGCRVGDRHNVTAAATLKGSKNLGKSDTLNDASSEYMEKETVIYVPMGPTGDSNSPSLDRQGTRQDSGPSKRWFDVNNLSHCALNQSHPQHPSVSTFAPTRCLSPSFTLVPPMAVAPWQRLAHLDASASLSPDRKLPNG
ncbi:neuroglian [Echinococcus multilocularis]|uniref:Neuroglian n=1 Tax=Echinococcus multilocularis TaxID=6211 RepID=A0A068Y669_ECHMU|nr:neuroglian [Echinococcus multilocularis]